MGDSSPCGPGSFATFDMVEDETIMGERKGKALQNDL